MSEKYSTDELVEEMYLAFENRNEAIDDSYCKSGNQQLVATGPDEKFHCREKRDAIIARLRAVDNLKNKSLMKLTEDLGVSFSAAKILEDHVRIEYDARLRAADKLCMIMNKIANWLERQIALTERLEKVNRGTFDSLADSCVLDEKTYRAQLEEVRKAIADYEEGRNR
jgi:hypothetical protein